jgi:AcrR family transcriptional regulator
MKSTVLAPMQHGERRAESYHHGDLRAACIAAGLKLVAAGGPDAITIRGVARLVGVSHTAPLHHFRDRDDLLAGIAEAGFDRLVTAAGEAITSSGIDPIDPIERVRRYGLAYIRVAIGSPGLYRLMFGEAARGTGNAAYDLLIRLVAESGLSVADPEPVALVLWAQVHGLAGLYAEGKLSLELEGLEPGQVPIRAKEALDRLIDALIVLSKSRHRRWRSHKRSTGPAEPLPVKEI